MESKEIMANEEMIDTELEKIVENSAGCGIKVAVGFGLGILAGAAICKLAKPVIAKIKKRKTEKEEEAVEVEGEFVEFEEVEE